MTEIAEQRTRALARLAVELGANVAPGQDVVVLALDVEHAGLAREIAEVAYESGAHYVSVLYWDQHVTAGNATPILRDDVWVLE